MSFLLIKKNIRAEGNLSQLDRSRGGTCQNTTKSDISKLKKSDPRADEHLYAITDARYSKKSVVLTSNRAMSDWGNIFPDPVRANALMDRICYNAHQ